MGRSTSGPTIDLATLAGMPHLENLRFRANHVTTIEPIGDLTGLRRLRIEDDTFESIAPLASVTGLRSLAIGWWKGMDRLLSGAPVPTLAHQELDNPIWTG